MKLCEWNDKNYNDNLRLNTINCIIHKQKTIEKIAKKLFLNSHIQRQQK